MARRRVRSPRRRATHPRRERLRAGLRRPGQAAARRADEPRVGARRRPRHARPPVVVDRQQRVDAISTRSRSPSRWTTAAFASSSAIADVDALVSKGTPLDEHAYANCTSVYTGVDVFPMLPEKLSTGLTSLNENEDRLAIAIETVVNADGDVVSYDVYRAMVRNKAQLAYEAVGAWLDGRPAAGQDRQQQDADRPAQASERGGEAAQGRASALRRARARDDRSDADHAGRPSRRPQGHRTRTTRGI